MLAAWQHAVALCHKGRHLVAVVVQGRSRVARHWAQRALPLWRLLVAVVDRHRGAPRRRQVTGVGWQIFQDALLPAVADPHDQAFPHQSLADQHAGGQVGLPRAGVAVVHKGVEAVLAVVHVQHRVTPVAMFIVAARQINIERSWSQAAVELIDLDHAGRRHRRRRLVAKDLAVLHPQAAQCGGVGRRKLRVQQASIPQVDAELPLVLGRRSIVRRQQSVQVGQPQALAAVAAAACPGQGHALLNRLIAPQFNGGIQSLAQEIEVIRQQY